MNEPPTPKVAAASPVKGPRVVASPRVPAVVLPVGFALALAATSQIASVAESPTAVLSVRAAAAVILAWTAIVFSVARARGRSLGFEVALKKQHWVQACTQGSILLYWGYYWREVYHSAPLILAELLFAYGFDMLLAWSRRDGYTLGFAPFPVIFSISLFLWFKPDFFYLQFLLVAVGIAGKELVAWQKDGRRAHVFNPSSFPLALFSLGLIVTGETKLTFAPEIATTLHRAPGIYAFIFTVSLVGQYFFGVTTMTMAAAVSMYAWSAAYQAVTGLGFFRDEYIPIAVFLGMHLLFTDPSTAPRTELGRLGFGVLYTLGILVTERLLVAAGAPGFYDKLLPVPLLNLTIQLIDRAARSKTLARFDPGRLGRDLAPRRRHLVYIGLWAAAFAAMNLYRPLGPLPRDENSPPISASPS